MSPLVIRLIIYLAIVAAFVEVGFYYGNKRGRVVGYSDGAKVQKEIDEAALAQQQRDAAAQLKTATEAAHAKQLEYDNAKAEWSRAHDGALRDLDSVRRDLSARRAAAGGMRDPGARSGPRCSGASPTDPTTTIPAVGDRLPAQADGVLSEEAQRFLSDFAYEADRDAEVATQCHVAATSPQ